MEGDDGGSTLPVVPLQGMKDVAGLTSSSTESSWQSLGLNYEWSVHMLSSPIPTLCLFDFTDLFNETEKADLPPPLPRLPCGWHQPCS